MSDSIFLSYSHRDNEAAKSLYVKLKQAGHSVWFDKESLLPGQDWEIEIRKAIVQAKAIIICLSSNWIQQRGYIHKELQIAIEVMKEIPEGQIHTIPVRFDDCSLPPSLARLQWVDIFEPTGHQKLERALKSFLAAAPGMGAIGKTENLDGYSEFMDDIIAKGGLIHIDPWQEAQTQEELAFKYLLKNRMDQSLDLQSVEDYQGIIDLWAPLEGNPYFQIYHKEWSDKPFFRVQIHTAKAHLFIACVQIGVNHNSEILMPRAFHLLNEIVKANPYSMKGGAPDRLPKQHAETQNLNYKDTLIFALEWFKGWGGGVLEVFDIPESASAALEKKVRERLYEIDLLFNIRGGAT